MKHRITSLEDLIESGLDLPDEWRTDAMSYAHSLRESLTSASGVVPADLAEGRTAEEAIRLAKEVVRNFGELVHWWPAITGAATELRSRTGGRLSRDVSAEDE